MGFQGNQFNFFTFALLPFAVIGFIFWQKYTKKKGLKKSYLNSSLLISFALFAALLLYIPMEPQIVWTVTYVLIGFALMGMVAGYILPNPIVSQLSDASKKSPSGSNSGAYFGSMLLMMNFSNTLGDLVLGFILSGNERDPIVLKAIFPITAMLFFLSFLFAKKIQLN